MAGLKSKMDNLCTKIQSYKGVGRPHVFHALVVIFAEFAVWGLLTVPIITALKSSFPGQTLMINGIIWGIKGTLSFLMSPLIGYLSDIYGRKPFLLITVVFTCLPVPVMFINYRWFFIMVAISGLFSVTFSVVFAYVADITTGKKMATSYGQVAATFAASLIITPSLGASLGKAYGDSLVVFIATIVAILDVLFILFIVPESISEKLKLPQSSLWERTDFISTIRKIGKDLMIWTICLAVFLSYLPEAGQFSCFFVYLKLVIGFTEEDIAIFIAVIGILSVLSQTILLTYLIDIYGGKRTIMFGLFLQAAQLFLLGFCRSHVMMWICGLMASLSSITYPAISAYVSSYADSGKQGLVQGLISAVRSLCGGIGPAMFGVLFWLYDVDMYESETNQTIKPNSPSSLPGTYIPHKESWLTWFGVCGPPFFYGSFLVGLAILVIGSCVPDTIMPYRRPSIKSSTQTNYYHYTSVLLNGNAESENQTPNNVKCDLVRSASDCELLEELED